MTCAVFKNQTLVKVIYTLGLDWCLSKFKDWPQSLPWSTANRLISYDKESPRLMVARQQLRWVDLIDNMQGAIKFREKGFFF